MKRLLSVLIAVAVMAGCAFTVSAESTRKERKLISAGNKLYKESKFKEAATQYQMAVAENPQSPEARFNLALAHLKMAAMPGVKEEDREKLSKSGREGMANVMQIGGANPKLASYAAYNLGNIAFNGQNYKEAIDFYKQSLRFNPDDDTARRNLRIAQKKLQDQNKDKNKDQNKDQDKKDQDKKDQEKNQDKNKNQDQQQNQNKDQKQQDNSMSNNTAEQILKAMENKENATRARVNAANQGKEAGEKARGRKNW